jgi:hypothetical protein
MHWPAARFSATTYRTPWQPIREPVSILDAPFHTINTPTFNVQHTINDPACSGNYGNAVC